MIPSPPPPPDPNDPRVAILLSGGVDSALAAALLRDSGHHVHAVTLRLVDDQADAGDNGNDDPDHGGNDDLRRARDVAESLGLPWTALDLRREFRELVLQPFVDAYLRGRTPSPCVDCNPTLKLGLAARLIREKLGIERLATGHYARIVQDGHGRVRLARAADARRDQSYFLYRLPPPTLARLVFPLGDAAGKEDVRQAARAIGLAPADREDSMDLCFLPGGDYRRLLPPPDTGDAADGRIVDTDGRVVGRHGGCAHFTVGQRKGLGAHAGPRYVVELRPEANEVVIGPRGAALRKTVRARRPVYAADGVASPGMELRGRVRSGGEPRPCRVVTADGGCLSVCFDEPRFAPAPGQHLVLYDETGLVAGGGEIS